jgi:hypothetical protein
MVSPIVDITWGEKKIPVKISFSAIMEMTAETGIPLAEVATEEGFNLIAMESLFYFSMIAGCWHRKIEPLFSREDSRYAWEDVFSEFTQATTVALTSSSNGSKKKKEKTSLQSQN